MVSDKKKDIWISYDTNPYNPFSQFDDWYAWDIAFGFDICGLIAKEAPTSAENLTDMENDELIDEAIHIVLDKYEESLGLKLVFGEWK
jgi:hypothetical protein